MSIQNRTPLLLMTLMIFALFSCATIPKKATAVSSFEKEKYLGTWYEIARFDFKFEKNLNNTTATYSLNDNGTLKVVNRGYDTIQKKWKQSVGKAKFVADETVAKLKVAFFGPFYGGYNVIAIDEDYTCALIAGGSLDYLWILSRETTVPETIKTKYLKIAKDAGYDTSRLLWIEHNAPKNGK